MAQAKRERRIDEAVRAVVPQYAFQTAKLIGEHAWPGYFTADVANVRAEYRRIVEREEGRG